MREEQLSMNVGDLVKCTEDPNADFGVGLVIAEETRMVKVLWVGGHVDDPPYIDDWNWKTNLELVVGLPENQ